MTEHISTGQQANHSGVFDETFARCKHAWSGADICSTVETMIDDGVYESSFDPEPWENRLVEKPRFAPRWRRCTRDRALKPPACTATATGTPIMAFGVDQQVGGI